MNSILFFFAFFWFTFP
ncbi:MAG: hypothetical protein ACKVIG_15525 [Flavobacteriales bacterium]